MGVLDGVVPYLVTMGDHDYDNSLLSPVDIRPTSNYNTYMGYNRFNNYSWFGGHYPENGAQAMYGFFSSPGKDKDFMVVGMEYCPTDDDLYWADNVISNNADKKVILFTHLYLNNKGTRIDANSINSCAAAGIAGNEGEDIWNKLISRHDNIILVMTADQFGFGVRVDYIGDVPVNQIMENFQSVTNGGNGYLSIYTFIPEENKIEVRVYSPYLNQYDTAPEHMFDFTYKN
jgi:hypothetical protein